MKKKIGILIDSSSTRDENFLKKNDIWVAPLSLTDGHLLTYKDDGKDITKDQLVERLKRGENFKTSMTPIGQLMVVVEQMFEKYEHIIFLPISKGLSSQWQSSQIIKKEYPNFHIVDSVSAAYTNEIILNDMVDKLNKGKMISEIISSANEITNKTFNIFSVEETSGMKSGGRITKTILHVIDILKLKPIIRFNVKNEYAGVTKNYRSGITKMIKTAKKWLSSIKSTVNNVCIYTSGYEESKFKFIKTALTNSFNISDDKISERWIPSVVLVHTKLGSYGFCLVAN